MKMWTSRNDQNFADVICTCPCIDIAGDSDGGVMREGHGGGGQGPKGERRRALPAPDADVEGQPGLGREGRGRRVGAGGTHQAGRKDLYLNNSCF